MADPTIIGNYQILRFLGEGGMGRVYVALHTVLEREVVVKRILPELASHAEIVRRFLVEARAAAKLAHRNIVVVHDAATDQDGVPFLALEFLKGQSLRAWLDQRRATSPFTSPQLVALVLAQAANALEYAHGKGIVHRDIKPDNVFLVRAPTELAPLLEKSRLPADLSVKVLDFGIAKLADEHAKDPRAGTGTAMALGTPSYMPPEQLTSARDVDARADVYALGAMVFEMLTGSVPWGDTGFAELHGRMMHEPTPDPRRLNPALTKRVAMVVSRALKRDRADRWSTVADFARAFCAEVPAGNGLPSGTEILHVYAPELASPTATAPPVVGPATEQQPGIASAATITPHAAVVATTSATAPRSSRGLVIALGAVGFVGAGVLAIVLASGGGGGNDARTEPAASTAPAIDASAPITDAGVPDAVLVDAEALVDASPPLVDTAPIDAPKRRTSRDPKPGSGSSAGSGSGSGSSRGIRDVLQGE